ncbi:MAG: hypothetical protein LBC02_06295 [Planctomycetaceae bacterium]|jgi:hypothetical protein|nr:hypothetical protein [Planctomycetaceae bacterium]
MDCGPEFLLLELSLGHCSKGRFFLIRHYASTRWIPTSDLVFAGGIETGTVFEQQGYLESPETGEQLPIRRLEVQLQTPTRDGDSVLGLFSNLLETISATEFGAAYRKRWWIETAFVAYNMKQCITRLIETAQPNQPQKISTYYVAHEIASCYRGLELGSEDHEREWATKMNPEEIRQFLLDKAARVEYKKFAKQPPSKKKQKKTLKERTTSRQKNYSIVNHTRLKSLT